MAEQLQLKQIVNQSARFASALHSAKLETEHLLYGVLCQERSFASRVLADLGITKASYEKVIKAYKQQSVTQISDGTISYSKNISLFLSQVNKTSLTNEEMMVNAEDVLFFLISKNEFKSYVILSSIFKIDTKALKQKIEPHLSMFAVKPQASSKSKVSNSKLPDALKDLGVDLTEKVSNDKNLKIIGRDDEITRVIEILCRKTKNNPVLIGEPGVGKTSVVEGLALKICLGDVPELLENKIVFSLDLASLMAGTKFRGSMEEKLKKAVDAIIQNDNIIVFIDEIHMLANAGKDSEISVPDILKPYLARGEMRCVGATTLSEYKEFIEKDSALERRFQPVNVDEPTSEDTIHILKRY